MSGTIISGLFSKIDAASQGYVTHGYDALVNNCQPLMVAVITAYIAWIGWKAINHWQGFTSGQFVKDTLKVAIIYSLATNWGFFSMYIYDVVTNGPNELSQLLLQSAGGKYDSLNSSMEAMFDSSLAVGSTLWDMGHLTGPLYWVMALDVWLFASITTGVAIVMVGVSKCFLGMLLVLAPVFVFFYLSDTFKGITESWMKLILGFAFVPLMVNAALLFTNNMLVTGMEEASKFEWGDIGNGIAVICEMDFGFAICVVLLFQSASLAAQMGNGMAVSSLEVGGMLSKIKNPLTGGPQKLGKWAGNKIKGKVGNAIKSRWNKR